MPRKQAELEGAILGHGSEGMDKGKFAFGEAPSILAEGKDYTLKKSADSQVLLFTWKKGAAPDDTDYMDAIRVIARNCQNERPRLLIVDKRHLSAQLRFDYNWWREEILPQYHASGMAGFAHVSGNPDARGEFGSPEGAKFKMAEFASIDNALAWKL